MTTIAFGVVLASFLSAWVWNEIFLRFARRLGALSQGIPNQRRWDSSRKPIIGGIAFFITALGIAAWRPADLEVSHAFLAGAAIAFLTGLADDAFVSLPYLKLVGQLSTAAVTLLLGGPMLVIPDMPILSIAFTLFWYAAVMNAFNMMDNMDGIAGSVGLVLLLSSVIFLPESTHFLLYVGLVGAVWAFLLRNWYPSFIYMGDNGTQFLGFVLAFWGTEWWQAPLTFGLSAWEKILVLVMIFALLAGDTFWVSVARLREGRSPFHGGTDHLTHRLARMGLPPRRIGLILGLAQAVLAFTAYLAITLSEATEWIALTLIGITGIAIGFIHAREMMPLSPSHKDAPIGSLAAVPSSEKAKDSLS